MDKTVVVAIEDNVRHPLYKKIVKRTMKLKAHDEANECRVGDRVEVKVSDTMKYFVVIKAVEKGEDNTELPISEY